ncbi:hypothetical protein BLA29_012896 [Euroglyphus maynei]|uniref:Calcineurin-like phosphoesterase domain-containing protein n=1 Tax=Euroglyphus maynei TaxID=6958 RepID=A0A1Y3BHQ5_EURMA|nr:hypothetical protein BLA29_012896 [Euroglyphus maynei]
MVVMTNSNYFSNESIEIFPIQKVVHFRILKICTGDLINKGPKNKQVLDYFMNNQDDCISVRGNHDHVMKRAI